MLDVHAVHSPARAWREFLVQIATIVVGLCIAVGIQQLVEAVQNHAKLSQTHLALQMERAENRQTFADQTAAWRWISAQLQNNLLVFQYLKEHPGTAQEDLPGILSWRYTGLSFNAAAWDSTHQSGGILLMSRKETEDNSILYQFLDRTSHSITDAAEAMNEARRYDLLDSDPSHLNPSQIAREIELTQEALSKHLKVGLMLQNFQAIFSDFPATVTQDEVRQLRHPPDQQTVQRLETARALTMQRLRAAGYVNPNDPTVQK